MLNSCEYADVLAKILKNGIKQFNSKNLVAFKKNSNKIGAIAGFTSKTNMIKTKGLIYRSIDRVLEDSDVLTHWTPNVYSWLGGGENKTIFGHKEANLIQINTFVADIDYPVGEKKTDLNLLVLYLLEEGLLPTLIVDTPKGYHCYFLIQNYNQETDSFDKASYISNSNDFKSLRVAKRISENIRKSIQNRLPQVDMGCNHFGIFRFPTKKNIVHYEPNFVDTFEGYLKWSKDFEEKEYALKRSNLSLLAPNSTGKKGSKRQIDTKWYDFLIHTDIAEGDRNKTIFTLALACKSSGLSIGECMDQLDQLQFNNDLSYSEVERTIRSAYRGDYKGAKSSYVNEIIENYATPTEFEKYSINVNRQAVKRKGNRVDPSNWVKFAKPREERKYSHFEESKADLLAYLERKQRSLKKNELFLSVSMGTISEETQIPVSTLKVILKELRTANTVILRTSRGRYGSTKIATSKFVEAKILNTVIQNKKDKQVFVLELLGTANSHVETILRRYEDKTVPFHVNILKEREKSKHAPIRGANTG